MDGKSLVHQKSYQLTIHNNCRWIKDEYDDPEVFITENGWSDKGELEDTGRTKYLHDHLESILNVVLSNETNLKGYTSNEKRPRSFQLAFYINAIKSKL